MTGWYYTVYSFWGPRRETPAALAERFNALIDRLAPIDPAFGNWLWLGADKRPIPFSDVRNHLADEIAACVSRGDDGVPEPVYGYWMDVSNSLDDTPRSLSLSVKAGDSPGGSVIGNDTTITTAWQIEPDPTIANYRVFKAALLACAECFDASFGMVYPAGLTSLWARDATFRFGWINYIAPRFAPLVAPPRTAIVEYRPDGGLLMAATTETFVTSNP